MDDTYTEKMKTAFYNEAEEILSELEVSLMDLEENSQDKEIINKVFRALHTLKGSGAMFGFDKIASFAHDIESVFDLVRNDEVSVTPELISLSLESRDLISGMLRDEDDDIITRRKEGIVDKLTIIVNRSSKEGPQQPDVVQAVAGIPKKTIESEQEFESDNDLAVYRIKFKPSVEIFLHGTNPINLIKELKEMGDCHVVAHLEDLPAFKEINAEYCYIFWEIILATSLGINAIKDVFIFVEDESELKIEKIDEETLLTNEGEVKKLGEILVERGVIDEDTLKGFLVRQVPIGKMLIEAGMTDKAEVESALAEQAQVKKIKESREKIQKESTLRVGSSKLDKLIDMVGELVTIQAGISQKALDMQDIEFQSLAEEMERITSALREVSMSMRMVPIETTFNRFKRLIRDLSRQLGKKIELVTEGGETQLDATIIERLVEPLMHLIRNSIDHGIEKVEGREIAGKKITGTIHLSAIHSGSYVLVQIRDDGAGLDREKVINRAVQQGLLSPGTIPAEKEIYKLIFAPGFSTAKEITGVSGRGVGMDVVKRTIDELGGSIDIESSPGEGTLISLKIPLTLAIIEGLLVRIVSEYYIIPLSSVEECIEIKMSEADRVTDAGQVNVRGNLIPYINLRKMFYIDGQLPEIDHIVIINTDHRKTGILVDEVIGEQQTVVKDLGIVYRDVEEISGATILGDGKIALILDVVKLLQKAELINEAV